MASQENITRISRINGTTGEVQESLIFQFCETIQSAYSFNNVTFPNPQQPPERNFAENYGVSQKIPMQAVLFNDGTNKGRGANDIILNNTTTLFEQVTFLEENIIVFTENNIRRLGGNYKLTYFYFGGTKEAEGVIDDLTINHLEGNRIGINFTFVLGTLRQN